jgi:hypothetical protein
VAAYAPQTIAAGAAQQDFTIVFPFLRDSHLRVVINSIVKVLSTDYTLVSGSTVMRLVVPAAGGETVVLSRVTPVDQRIVDFAAGGAISETALDESFLQLFYNLEELLYTTEIDNITQAVDDAQAAATASAASATAASGSATSAQSSEDDAETAQQAAQAAALTATLMRNYISGFTLVRTSSTVITVGDGVAMDSTNAEMINLAASATITLTVSGVGGLGVARPSGAAAWFHAFAVKRTTGGTVYVYADTSVTAANKPTGADAGTHRRVGSFLINADVPGITVDFSQFGEEFLWKATVLDADVPTPGTTAVSRALTVPLGVQVHALVNVIGDFTDAQGGYLSSLDVNDEAAAGINGAGTAPLATFGGGANSGRFNAIGGVVSVRTDTSRQIRTRMNVNVRIKIATLGWIDQRGKNG